MSAARARSVARAKSVASAPASEAAFQARLLLALGRRQDMRVYRQNVGTVLVRDAKGKAQRTFRAGPPPGAADISGIVRPEGWRLEVECKAVRGKRSEAQQRWADMITAAGGVYALVAPVAGEDEAASVARAVETITSAIVARRAREASASR